MKHKTLGDGDGRRIVACYNACSGLNPEAIPELVVALEQITEHAYDEDTDRLNMAADFDNMRRIAFEALKAVQQ